MCRLSSSFRCVESVVGIRLVAELGQGRRAPCLLVTSRQVLEVQERR